MKRDNLWSITIVVFLIGHLFLTDVHEIRRSLTLQTAATQKTIATISPTATHNKTACHQSLSPHSFSRNNKGTWIGNWWIPPKGWSLYSAEEIDDTFKDRSVLWIGDSTARRSSTTLYYIIQHSNSTDLSPKTLESGKVINVNLRRKGGELEPCTKWDKNTTLFHPSFCRPMPRNHTNDFIYISRNCFSRVEQFFKAELSGASNITANINTIIVSLGVWHVARARDCREKGRSTNDTISDTLEALFEFQRQRPDMTIIWRTMNYYTGSSEKSSSMNEYIMNRIDQYRQENATTSTAPSPDNGEQPTLFHQANNNNMVTYVDWGTAGMPRTVGSDRISADIPAHTGLETRLLLTQMITNTLKDMGQQHPPMCPPETTTSSL